MHLTVRAVDDAPVGNADTYSVETGSITVAAPGVLANDHDIDGDTMTATLSSTTSHGSLTLDADGVFTYTPAAGYSGSDGFTYRVRANGALSDPVTVTIQVTALPTTGGSFTFEFVPDDDLALRSRRQSAQLTSGCRASIFRTSCGRAKRITVISQVA